MQPCFTARVPPDHAVRSDQRRYFFERRPARGATTDGELCNHVAVVGDRDLYRLSCSLSLRAAEHELPLLDERDADPRIMLAKNRDDRPEQLVAFTALVDECPDRLDRVRLRAHASRVSP